MNTELEKLNCLLCDIEFKNSLQLKQHLDGKKHKSIEAIKNDREKNANRSIFVSGLKRDIFLKHLEEHFLQFGKINKIIQDQEKNAYAIIEYETDESAEKALSHKEDHLINNRLLKVNKRQLKEFVSRVPNRTDKKTEALDKIKTEALVVNKILGKCHTFDEQIESLVKYLELDEEKLQIRRSIVDRLKNLFNKYWPDGEFKISTFGSTLTKLATAESDMDMTILFDNYFPANALVQQKIPKVSQKNHSIDGSESNSIGCEHEEIMNLEENSSNGDDEQNKEFKNAIRSFFNEKEYHLFASFEIEQQVKILANIIQRFDGIKHLRTVLNTRCPVVRFFHEKANIFCDISVNNYLAVANSKLIELYLNLEPNLRKFLFILRYWMKHKNLSSSKFNGYITTWMAIFYMQKKNIGFLPTVQHLADMKGSKKMVHGWNCEFESDIQKILASKPSKQLAGSTSLNDMLKGFFEFYSTFQFNRPEQTIIISTSKGEVTTEETALSKVTAVFNMQDPFDLSHNISANISQKVLDHFVAECKGSFDLLEYSKNPKKCENKCWGLILLMTKKVLPIIASTKTLTSVKSVFDRSVIKLKFSQPTGGDNMAATLKKSIEFVLYVLKSFLLFEEVNATEMVAQKRKRLRVLNQICDKVDSLGLGFSPKRLKTDSDDSSRENSYANEKPVNGKLEQENEVVISSFQFRINNSTWRGRRSVKREAKQQNPQISPYELEKLISRKLVEQAAEAGAKTEKDLLCNVEFLQDFHTSEKKNLKIIVESLDGSDNVDLVKLTTLVHFLEDYINNCYQNFFSQWEADVYSQKND